MPAWAKRALKPCELLASDEDKDPRSNLLLPAAHRAWEAHLPYGESYLCKESYDGPRIDAALATDLHGCDSASANNRRGDCSEC